MTPSESATVPAAVMDLETAIRTLPPLSTVADLAARFDITREWISTEVGRGNLKGERRGRGYVFTADAVLQWTKTVGFEIWLSIKREDPAERERPADDGDDGPWVIVCHELREVDIYRGAGGPHPTA